MANITARSTKAEILAAYQAVIDQPTTAEDVRLWIAKNLATARVEFVALVKDCYRLGQWTRRCYDSVRSEFNRPLFKG